MRLVLLLTTGDNFLINYSIKLDSATRMFNTSCVRIQPSNADSTDSNLRRFPAPFHMARTALETFASVFTQSKLPQLLLLPLDIATRRLGSTALVQLLLTKDSYVSLYMCTAFY